MTTPQMCRDVAGQPLAVGDRVATLTPSYRYKLSLGVIEYFTPKGIKVRLDSAAGLVQVFREQVCRVPHAH